MITFSRPFAWLASRWQRALVQLVAVVCLGAAYAGAQAIVEYGGAVSTVGAAGSKVDKLASALKPLGEATSVLNQTETKSDQAPSAHLPMEATEDVVGANRRALEAKAGKNGAKLMLRSVPDGARVWMDGKVIGTTPLLVIVAPGVYKVEMEALQFDSAFQKVDLLPKETREVHLTLAPRYPARMELSWQRH